MQIPVNRWFILALKNYYENQMLAQEMGSEFTNGMPELPYTWRSKSRTNKLFAPHWFINVDHTTLGPVPSQGHVVFCLVNR